MAAAGSAGLNPDAPHFLGGWSPVDWGERISFSDSDEFYDSDPLRRFRRQRGKAKPSRGKAVARVAVGVRGMMEGMASWLRPVAATLRWLAVRAPYCREDATTRSSSPPVTHPARASGLADGDGFHQVQSCRRWWRRSHPKKSKPVPPHLVGRCFNCGGDDHIKADCVSSSRCTNCESECHRMRDCPPPHCLGGNVVALQLRGPACVTSRLVTGLCGDGRHTLMIRCPRSRVRRGMPNLADGEAPIPDAPNTDAPNPDAPALAPHSGERASPKGHSWGEVPRRSPELVVVPRSQELEAAELDLRLALVALMARMRPAVSPRMVHEYLATFLGIVEVSIQCHDPEDFIVRFSRQDDLELVLYYVVPNTPFSLIWHTWRRTSLASTNSFHFRVLVGMCRVPLHMPEARRLRRPLWGPRVPTLSSHHRTSLHLMMTASSS